MSRDDLEWVFGGEVDFVDADTQQPLLVLDVPLLGFADDLSRLVGQLRTDGSYEMPDRYGSYRLVVTVNESGVRVSDLTAGRFEAEGSQLISAIENFAEGLRDSLTKLFPELNANPEFNRMFREMTDRFLADQKATESLRRLGWRAGRDDC